MRGQRNPLLQQWSCALFCSMWLHFCWVMICAVTTRWPTQTQGHTHHDTVESVWLRSRSTRKGEEGKKPRNVTDVFVLIVALLLPLSLRLSIHHQLHLSLSLTLPLSPPHLCPSVTITTSIYCPRICLLSIALPSLPSSFHAKQACFIWNHTVSIHNLLGVPSKSFGQTWWTFGVLNICVCCINRVCIFVKPDVWGIYRWRDMEARRMDVAASPGSLF